VSGFKRRRAKVAVPAVGVAYNKRAVTLIILRSCPEKESKLFQ
jgi:hypothetical protein